MMLSLSDDDDAATDVVTKFFQFFFPRLHLIGFSRRWR